MNKLKIFLLLILSVTGIANCHARLRYGFKFGASIADGQLSHPAGFDVVNKGGFRGGLTLEYQWETTGWAAEASAMYNRYNLRLRDSGGNVLNNGRNYFEIPLHVKYKFWLSAFNDLAAPMIYTGPAVMFHLDGNRCSSMQTFPVHAGWDVGVGFDIVNFIEISGGYRFGLTNAMNHLDGAPDARLLCNGWNVTLSLLFDF